MEMYHSEFAFAKKTSSLGKPASLKTASLRLIGFEPSRVENAIRALSHENLGELRDAPRSNAVRPGVIADVLLRDLEGEQTRGQAGEQTFVARQRRGEKDVPKRAYEETVKKSLKKGHGLRLEYLNENGGLSLREIRVYRLFPGGFLAVHETGFRSYRYERIRGLLKLGERPLYQDITLVLITEGSIWGFELLIEGKRTSDWQEKFRELPFGESFRREGLYSEEELREKEEKWLSSMSARLDKLESRGEGSVLS